VKKIPIAFYRCEKCRREYPSSEAAEQCEAEHLIPVSATVKSYSTRRYPYSVEITFSNGEKRIYNAEDMGG